MFFKVVMDAPLTHICCTEKWVDPMKGFSYKMRRLPVVMHVPLSGRPLLRHGKYALVVDEFCIVVLTDQLPHSGEIRGYLPLENSASPVFLQLPISPFCRRVLVFEDADMAVLCDMLGRGLVLAGGRFGGWLW